MEQHTTDNPAFQTKTEYAVARLREAFEAGRYEPGQRLPVAKLAKEFGFSLTPVREALAKLASEGLVEMDPHRGARVAEISLHDLQEVYLVRQILEPAAARLAADNVGDAELEQLRHIQKRFTQAVAEADLDALRPLNDEFHHAIYDASGVPLLRRMVRSIWSLAPHDTFKLIRERPSRSVEHHENILDALERRDAEKAEQSMHRHVAESFELIRSTKEQMPGEVEDAGEARSPSSD